MEKSLRKSLKKCYKECNMYIVVKPEGEREKQKKYLK